MRGVSMVEGSQQVAHLKKVVLLIKAGRSADVMDILSEPYRIEFIFGIGHGGLTPFECEMAERRVGDAVGLAVSPDNMQGVFGHLSYLLPDLPADDNPLYFQITVEAAAESSPREVIRALAELASCGSHCCEGG